ncbi:dicarboxylate/amino acid:cation symporter [uncultured Acetobacteroides sp.]|uniref:dicarboxylate/amino acid:cation symporter n=1 Tax=uncultured Acetobacteroides sp. TaxID=1760811 RepID=UPI0029F4B57B|nr:dicarboxylate/amino acid:cation symporter [uncultured Acetobacteroides sp.]
MKKIELYWQILIAFVLAILFGIFFKNQVHYVAWMGVVFIKALKMIIIPLIFASMISGVSNIGDAKNLGRLGAKTVAYYLGSSVLALLTGLILVNLIKPGVGADLGFKESITGVGVVNQSFGDTLLTIIPDNIVKAMVENNMLGIIFFGILFGFFIIKVDKVYKDSLTNIFNGLFEVIMKFTMFIIKFTPLGIFGIVANQVASQSNLGEVVARLGMYIGVVLLGLVVHSMISLPLILKFIGKVHPLKQLRAMRIPLFTAFTTSSSNAALPFTMEALEDNSGVSKTIVRFMLPIGTTVNMNGTALYELVAAIFIAQAYGIDLTLGQQAIVLVTTLMASIGAAGIPMAGLVMITIILSAIGLPMEGIGLILSVDRILDMFRTAVNVWSDSCGAVVVAHSEGETLKV